MRQSVLFPKTKKQAPREAESISHKLLVRAGFIDQLMAGSWTLLPLGWRVVAKINQIIREEMNAIGGQEVLMPLLHPKSIWNETGRWESAKEVMYQFKDLGGKEFALSFTHEEIVMDLLRKNIKSYQDLPVAVYHFSTKFRNEPRVRSGILRSREFMMKDLYSAHASEEDLMSYYETVKNAYAKIFKRLGLEAKIIEAGGGVFTDKRTHEFQVLAPAGEDTIYYCSNCGWGENKEIFAGNPGDFCPKCKEGLPAGRQGKMIEARAIEVGNIFPLGTWYAEKMGVYFTDKDGQRKPVWFGSYGIGPTRVLGTLVEVYHDEKGIIWPREVAPFACHLIEILDKDQGRAKAQNIYKALQDNEIEVLYDDREDVSPGVKFADCDLIGIPVRLVVSQKTGDKIEWKERGETKEEILSLEKAISRLKKT